MMHGVPAALMRVAANAMLMGGGSLLVAGLTAAGALSGSPIARSVASAVLQIGGVLVAAGGAARYLSGTSAAVRLPNERAALSDADRPALDGWMIALAVVLVAVPVWLVLRLRPFFAWWREIAAVIERSRIWEAANANGAGLILMPIVGALTLPAIELATAAAFLLAPLMLLPLLLSRSSRFPRAYLVSMLLLTALVFASARAAGAGLMAVDGVQKLMRESNARPGETARAEEVLQRYTIVVGSTARALSWAFCGLVVWLPAVVLSARARSVFAVRAAAPAPDTPIAWSVEGVTRPPRSPQ